MTEVKAIETIYQGHRFRSRLEARWAVFFDALGVEWQYEPQGFEKGGDRYLPDFLLKVDGKDIWCEVKGDKDWLRNSIDRLNTWFTGDPIIPGGRMLLLGDLPRPLWGQIVARKAGQLPDRSGAGIGWTVLAWAKRGFDLEHFDHADWYLGVDEARFGFGPFIAETPLAIKAHMDALNAARMARFEHGESAAR